MNNYFVHFKVINTRYYTVVPTVLLILEALQKIIFYDPSMLLYLLNRSAASFYHGPLQFREKEKVTQKVKVQIWDTLIRILVYYFWPKIRCCFKSKFINYGTNFAVTRVMPKSFVKIEWYEPIDMFRYSATSNGDSTIDHYYFLHFINVYVCYWRARASGTLFTAHLIFFSLKIWYGNYTKTASPYSKCNCSPYFSENYYKSLLHLYYFRTPVRFVWIQLCALSYYYYYYFPVDMVGFSCFVSRVCSRALFMKTLATCACSHLIHLQIWP